MATPAVGEDIEALCGRCGQVWHVVMAKMGDRIAKVVCKRCGGHHGYRTREADGAEAAAPAASRDGKRVGRRGATRGARREAPPPLIPPFDPTSRRARTPPRRASAPASALTHPAFGTGVVTGTPGPGSVEIAFPAGVRVLACAKAVSTLERPAAVSTCRSRIARRSRTRERRPEPSSPGAALPRGRAGEEPGAIDPARPSLDLSRRRSRAPEGAARRRARHRDRARRHSRSRAASGTRARPSRCACSRRATRPREVGARRRARVVDARLGAALDRRLAFIDRARDRRLPAGSTARPIGCPASTSISTAPRLVRSDGAGARAFYRDLPALPRGRGAAARGAAARRRSIERGRRRGRGRASAGRRPARRRDRGARERRCASASTSRTARRAGSSSTSATTARSCGTLARGPARAEPVRLHGRLLDLRGAPAAPPQTTTVDVARAAIAAARRNFERNGLSAGARPHLHAADAFAFLERAVGRPGFAATS